MKSLSKKIKTESIFCIIFLSFSTQQAHAELSYGSKFLLTTAGGCVIGGAGAHFQAQNTGYDSQPKQIVTWLGTATGCLTGAIFSYFFYDDNTATLNTRIAAQQQTISQLSNQLSYLQSEKQNGFSQNGVVGTLPNPFDHLQVTEGIAKQNFDLKNLPPGLNLKSCSRLWQYSLINDGNDIQPDKGQKSKDIIAVSKNFALVGFTFLYTPNDCFSPSSHDGKYAETYFPGLELFLKKRVINYYSIHKD